MLKHGELCMSSWITVDRFRQVIFFLFPFHRLSHRSPLDPVKSGALSPLSGLWVHTNRSVGHCFRGWCCLAPPIDFCLACQCLGFLVLVALAKWKTDIFFPIICFLPITFLLLSLFCLGCFECCIKCLGGVPYASLVATILCFSGVALFCGCGHVALTGTVSILEQHFSTTASDHALLSEV